MAQTPLPPSQIIRARRLELVDEHGNIKITLDAKAEGSVIRLWGKDGRLKGWSTKLRFGLQSHHGRV